MPKYIKPPKPQLVWGVYDQHRQLVVPEPVRPDRSHRVGWKCDPSYSIGGSTITPSREEADARLAETTRRWERRVRELQRAALTMVDLFEGREFRNALPDPFYDSVHFYLSAGGFITLERTRWANVNAPKITGAYETPFTVTKVYATGRKLKIEDGTYLEFPRKMGVVNYTVPKALLDQIYGTD